MPTGKRRRSLRRRPSAGFTYLVLLILVALIGMVAASGVKLGALMQRRAAEQALLDIGGQFADALKSYAAATPAGKPEQPPSIRELLSDTRFPVTRRHLRQNFVDPITGKAEWGVTWLADDVGVLSIHSLSRAAPLKLGNFDPQFQGFEGKSAYREWEFGIEQAHVAAVTPGAAGSRTLVSPLDLMGTPDAPAPALDKTGRETPSTSSPNLISPLDLR